MSRKTTEPEIVAFLLSDIHLCHQAPAARSIEPNWYAAMLRPWIEIIRWWNEADCPPIICAGDVFDKWNSPPELINFALNNLPDMYCVAGQHDLPYHDASQIERSAFATLVHAGTIICLGELREVMQDEDFALSSRSSIPISVFGQDWIEDGSLPDWKPVPKSINIAVMHHLTTTKSHSMIEGASSAFKLQTHFAGFDIVLTGDNHESFLVPGSVSKRHPKMPIMFNPGSLMRRRMDQAGHRPCVGLVMSDGSLDVRELDCRDDKMMEVSKRDDRSMAAYESLIETIRSADASMVDFRDSVREELRRIDPSPAVMKMILEAIEQKAKIK